MEEGAQAAERAPRPRGSVAEVALLALRLGFTAFGGPAAHIAMLRDKVVTRRKWVSDAHFLDLLGATNLIPGPNSTEMVIHIGQVRAGWRGMVAAGVCFIAPAALIVLACAWAYVQFGALPAFEWLLYGIKAVDWLTVALALAAALLLFRLKLNSAWLVLAGGLIALLLRWLLPGLMP